MATKSRQEIQARYNSKPEQLKKRAQRNQARRIMIKQGKASKGDGKDVAHLNNKTNNNSPKNLQMQSPAKNRSFKRNSNAGRA